MDRIAYLYKLENCAGCESALLLLEKDGYKVTQYILSSDDPLRQLGNQILFKDGLIHAPVIWKPNDGVYILDGSKTQFLRILNLKGNI